MKTPLPVHHRRMGGLPQPLKEPRQRELALAALVALDAVVDKVVAPPTPVHEGSYRQ